MSKIWILLGGFVWLILAAGTAILMVGCDWDGSIYLEDTDSSTGTGSSDGDTDADSDTDSDADSDADADTSSGGGHDTDTWWDTDQPDDLDSVVVRVYVPTSFSGVPRSLCGMLYEDKPSVDNPLTLNVCNQNPSIGPDKPYELFIPQNFLAGLNGFYFVGAVLFMEEGSPPWEPPMPGVDFIGFTEQRVYLEPGVGIVHGGNIYTNVVSSH